MRRTDYVDQEGNTLLSVHMWAYDGVNCAQCGAETFEKHAVPWYYKPVAEGESDGGYKCVCKNCYDKWLAKFGATK